MTYDSKDCQDINDEEQSLYYQNEDQGTNASFGASFGPKNADVNKLKEIEINEANVTFEIKNNIKNGGKLSQIKKQPLIVDLSSFSRNGMIVQGTDKDLPSPIVRVSSTGPIKFLKKIDKNQKSNKNMQFFKDPSLKSFH